MLRFDKQINIILENLLNVTDQDVDANVFKLVEGQPPVLQQSIRQQILQDANHFNNVVPVQKVLILDSILLSKEPMCPIDVHVQVVEHQMEGVSIETLLRLVKKLNNKLATGTRHPIQYHIETKPININDYECGYNVVSYKWLFSSKRSL